MAANTQTPRRHVVSRAALQVGEVLDEVAESSVWSMDPDETAATLTVLTKLEARVGELKLRVAAHADDARVGEASGATSTANWWAHATQQTRPEAHKQVRLAQALANGHEPVRAALAAGDLVVEQARVIVNAVEQLPADLESGLVEQAERFLIGEAAHHDARALRILGWRLFEVIAPDQADEREAKLLEREERDAAAAVRFTMSEDSHGRVYGRFTLDALHGAMLKKHLLALAAPKHQAATTGPLGERRPGPERMGRAFAEFIERYPVEEIPNAGGVAATVVVTIDLATLLGGLKAGTLDTGEKVTAGTARRLACEAGIIPAVLGGCSEVLDIGRKGRFHTAPMRVAMALRDGGCTATGCDWPPGLCHAHHDIRWADGGCTNTKDGRLLCPRHHARAHDPDFTMTKLPGGKVAFTRQDVGRGRRAPVSRWTSTITVDPSALPRRRVCTLRASVGSGVRPRRTLVGAMTSPTVYLDHAATTPMVPAAVEAMTRAPPRGRQRELAARLRAARPPGRRGVPRDDRAGARTAGPARSSSPPAAPRPTTSRSRASSGPAARRTRAAPASCRPPIEHHAVLDPLHWLGDARGRRGRAAAGRPRRSPRRRRAARRRRARPRRRWP